MDEVEGRQGGRHMQGQGQKVGVGQQLLGEGRLLVGMDGILA